MSCVATKKETLNHLFLTCIVAKAVWSLYYNWIEEDIVLHSEPTQHLNPFTILRLNVAINRVWGAMWIVIIEKIWRQK